LKLIRPADLALAIEAVESGKLVVLPTRRWYMVCANASDADACGRIFTGKRRPTAKSLLYVLPTREAAADLFELTTQAERLASAFWPGDLAMILPWRAAAMGEQHRAVGATNALVTLAPGVLGELATGSRVPIAATTVNISGGEGTIDRGPAITPMEVKQFVDATGVEVEYCVDGGICPLANHLTIVDCTSHSSQVIRSGVVHDRAIEVALHNGNSNDHGLVDE
jgi:L-threonylcarbamoyladenylate synthase